MATDDVSQHSIPCLCGAGTIEVTTTSPDHPWVRASQIHTTYAFSCRPCAAQYVIDEEGRIRLRSEVDARRAADDRVEAARRAFDRRADVEVVREAFAAHLDGLPSVAAVYRFLDELRLASYSISGFRNNWRGGRDWVTKHGRSRNIRAFLDALGHDATPFAADLDRIDELAAAVPTVRTVARCAQ